MDPYEKLARILFCGDNPPGTEYISGARDAIGIVFPGLARSSSRWFSPVEVEVGSPSPILPSPISHLPAGLGLQEGLQVGVRVDEYDKPIIDNLENEAEARRIREVLKGFYGVLKGLDEYLRFVLLTGVSTFSKVGVFSGLNNLKDITLDDRYDFTDPEVKWPSQWVIDSSVLLALRPGDDNPHAAAAQAFMRRLRPYIAALALVDTCQWTPSFASPPGPSPFQGGLALSRRGEDVILAFIFSVIRGAEETALWVVREHPDFVETGLKKDSVIKLDKLATVSRPGLAGASEDPLPAWARAPSRPEVL